MAPVETLSTIDERAALAALGRGLHLLEAFRQAHRSLYPDATERDVCDAAAALRPALDAWGHELDEGAPLEMLSEQIRRFLVEVVERVEQVNPPHIFLDEWDTDQRSICRRFEAVYGDQDGDEGRVVVATAQRQASLAQRLKVQARRAARDHGHAEHLRTQVFAIAERAEDLLDDAYRHVDECGDRGLNADDLLAARRDLLAAGRTIERLLLELRRLVQRLARSDDPRAAELAVRLSELADRLSIYAARTPALCRKRSRPPPTLGVPASSSPVSQPVLCNAPPLSRGQAPLPLAA